MKMQKQTKQLLVIDDVGEARHEIASAFARCDDFQFVVKEAANLQQAEHALQSGVFDVIIIDVRLGNEPEAGLELMKNQLLFASCPDAVKIVVTAYPKYELCVQ